MTATCGAVPPHQVSHPFKFFAAREDFIALVERASKPATPTFLSALRAAHPFWLRLRRFVGRPILAAAGFSRLPALPSPPQRAEGPQHATKGDGLPHPFTERPSPSHP